MPPESSVTVAVLYQAVEAPMINGVRKPKKPGGYQDSGADIAYVLQQSGVQVLTPAPWPDPKQSDGWCFPDTEDGIVEAVERGATHLWANTILFKSHPLQSSSVLEEYAASIRVVGQPPRLVEQYDDKNYVNNLLRRDGSFDMPKSWIVTGIDLAFLASLPYPVVSKPIRGRGSHGVRVCHDQKALVSHLQHLLTESSPVLLEEYLSGQECTITVMPPSETASSYWAMPVVVRFNHEDGVAPYNGTVAVTANSMVLSNEDFSSNPIYEEVSKQCERVASLLGVRAPIRIDARQHSASQNAKFALFDINMKPNMTGPGRPGREDQASLTAMAAEVLGWSYSDLLRNVLASAQTLEHLRSIDINQLSE